MGFLSKLSVKQYFIFSGLILVLAGLFIFWLVGFVGDKKEALAPAQEQSKPIEVFNVVAGEIWDISENKITLEVNSSLLEQFPTVPKIRTVAIDDKTEIMERKPKDRDAFRAELEKYEKNLTTTLIEHNINPEEFMWREGASYDFYIAEYPKPYTEKVLLLSDLEKGDTVSVEGEADVMWDEEFKAITIIRHEQR